MFSVFGLFVGVSNDAVNFLNSAIGSKAAPRYVILLVSSIGIVLGATFSSGMMEVARSGMFNPAALTFEQVMMIYLSVMITNIILLDFFNSLGMPTSTTVSLVFALLGAAVTVSIVSISRKAGSMEELSQYINTAKALTIIAGILISVVLAFLVGTIVQFFARLLFSFTYHRTYKLYGGIWGGLSLTAILYFIIIKGLKDSSISSPELIEYLNQNAKLILLGMFLVSTLILQLIILYTKLNIFRIVVLSGTFALALAFAGNDLVNFIGVSVAGYDAYLIRQAAGGDIYMLMDGLKGDVMTSPLILTLAGVIMVITLWTSKKTRTVTETEISLANQHSGTERFGSTPLSRGIVRNVRNLGNNITSMLPRNVNSFIERRFRKTTYAAELHTQPSFDLVRASVNLAMASILIASATSLRLPLSTTYVTFMVAMGASLSDKAWGRESAVYRVTGVLTVIGGWFVTALVAFLAAAIVAAICYIGGFWGVGFMLLLSLYLVYKSNKLHKKRQEAIIEPYIHYNGGKKDVMDKCVSDLEDAFNTIKEIFTQTIIGLNNEDRKHLKQLNDRMDGFTDHTKLLKQQVYQTLTQFSEEAISTGHYYVQVIDYLREIAHSLSYITRPSFEHINNQHQGFNKEQIEELEKINQVISEYFEMNLESIINNDFTNLSDVARKQQEVLYLLNEGRKNEVKRIKKRDDSTRNAILYLALINETKNLVLQSLNLLKAQRDFITEN